MINRSYEFDNDKQDRKHWQPCCRPIAHHPGPGKPGPGGGRRRTLLYHGRSGNCWAVKDSDLADRILTARRLGGWAMFDEETDRLMNATP